MQRTLPRRIAGVTPDTQTPRTAAKTQPLTWLDEHGDALLAYALARVSDAALAEDLVQETFLAALRASDSFRGDASERTWLVGILRRKVADYYRRESRQPRQTPSIDVHDAATTRDARGWPPDPSKLLEHEEFREKLAVCLEKLPKSIAGAFVLRTMDGVSVEELCNMFDISATNLRVRLHRARVALRDCLNKNLG